MDSKPKINRSIRIDKETNEELQKRGFNVSEICNEHLMKLLNKNKVCPHCQRAFTKTNLREPKR